MVAASSDAQRPLVQAAELVHLAGDVVNLSGEIRTDSATSRLVVNAIQSATFLESVDAAGVLEVNAGVDANWSDSKLLGSIAASELVGGNVTTDGATLNSAGDSRVQAGGDVHVVGSATVGDTPVPTKRPIITTVPRTIQVVTGTRQVAVGAVDVPLVSFVTTTTTEEVGRERVRVGSYFNTADITLVQTGYYNATTNTRRVFFVEDVDWSNTDPTINWLQKYDASGRIVSFPTGSAPPADREWGQLFPEQRDAVLIHLGYRPLYNVEFNNLWRNQTVNGIPSRVAWHPSWENDYTVKAVDTTTGMVTFYDGTGYGGQTEAFGVGDYSQVSRDNSYRSVRVPAGFKVTVFSGSNFTGAFAVFTSDSSNLANNGISDAISSVRIEQIANPTVTYKQYNSTSIYHVDVAGWNDKYVILPQGIDSDTLRLVSQGEPVTY
ncbi:MAG TPA: hypothetical protein PLV92_25180, partial [Pirellulaceae bacterium]|nr:hypothetical protein [Pirellulaceae bacterium]